MNERRPKLLVIGDVMLDIIAAPQRAIELGTDTPATVSLLPGGSGANQAAWLGHFGNGIRFAGRVGPDGAPEHAAALRAHGVEPIFVRDPGVRTGVLVTLVDARGERSFLTDRGANARLACSDLPDGLLDGIDLVHVSGYAFSTAGARAAVLDLLAAATARALPFTVDSGSSAVMRDVGSAAFLAATRAATICFVNAAEASVLANADDPATQLEALGENYATVVITCGSGGACAATSHGRDRYFAQAASVAAVDTSGAGDAFLAGFLSAYLRGEGTQPCLHAGVRAGAAAVSHYGGRPIAGASQPGEITASFALKETRSNAG